MSRFWSDHIHELVPYVPGEQPKQQLLKLNTNEHAYGPSPRVFAAIAAKNNDDLRLYPPYEASALLSAIAKKHNVATDQVFLGNGSDEVLAHVFNTLFLREGRPLLLPDITYSFYKTYCAFFKVPAEVIPLAEDFTIRVEDYTREREVAPAAIIFANPNAPTGIALALDDIAHIAQANPDSAVVVDEAYVDFGADSAVALIAQHPNIVVIHTLSKSYALAGLRVGYAVASAEIVAGLQRVKDSFNSYPLDTLAQAGAVAAIEDQAYFDEKRFAIMQSRDKLTKDLQQLGFEVLPSKTNFVFARHADHEAQQLHQGLRDRHILVRHFQQPRIEQFLRITVGTPEQCAKLIAALREILNA
ncbi:MAG: histidinol-phosphate transaminase [Alcaligenaceae bacterium]|uniref:Histidinol-phosphate aminotransferase n=1 Tax=Paenalcaligenes hermetiae TaxID=1157987 RepID=A0ABP9LVR5_9BURK|nr:histidinol-phosphate transaminase [Alcaligenaceae bacterium]